MIALIEHGQRRCNKHRADTIIGHIIRFLKCHVSAFAENKVMRRRVLVVSGRVGLVDTPVSDLAATPDTDDAIYDLRGMRVATKATAHRLPAGIYVVNHRKVLLTPNRR